MHRNEIEVPSTTLVCEIYASVLWYVWSFCELHWFKQYRYCEAGFVYGARSNPRTLSSSNLVLACTPAECYALDIYPDEGNCLPEPYGKGQISGHSSSILPDILLLTSFGPKWILVLQPILDHQAHELRHHAALCLQAFMAHCTTCNNISWWTVGRLVSCVHSPHSQDLAFHLIPSWTELMHLNAY